MNSHAEHVFRQRNRVAPLRRHVDLTRHMLAHCAGDARPRAQIAVQAPHHPDASRAKRSPQRRSRQSRPASADARANERSFRSDDRMPAGITAVPTGAAHCFRGQADFDFLRGAVNLQPRWLHRLDAQDAVQEAVETGAAACP